MIVCGGNICQCFLFSPSFKPVWGSGYVALERIPNDRYRGAGDEAITVDGSLMGGNGGGDIHSGSTVTVRV